jgi:hypothetical protein
MDSKLKILLIFGNEGDSRDFLANVAQHEQLREYEFEITYRQTIDLAIDLMRDEGPGAFDVVCFDPDALGAPGSWGRELNFLRSHTADGLLLSIADPRDSDQVWARLKASIGGKNVYSKADVLTPGSWPSFVDKLAKTSSSKTGKTERWEIESVQLRQQLELHGQASSSRFETLDREVTELERRVRIIDQTLFQGPGTATPAVCTILTEMRRQILALDRDIGSLADTQNKRVEKLAKDLGRLKGRLDTLESEQKKEALDIRLRSLDFRHKIMLIGLLSAISALMVWLLGLGVEEVASLIRTILN